MLQEIATDLWAIETPFQFMAMDMGARMSIVRRSRGELLVYAPFGVSDEDADSIREKGEVRDILAPNSAHYTEVGEFARRFPNATVWTLPDIDKRLGKVPHRHLDMVPESWNEDFEYLLVEGMFQFNEWVLLHRASRSLLVTDLSFHLPAPTTPMGRISTRLNGVSRRFGTTRFIRHLIRLGDKERMCQSVRIILGWDFERIVPGHGFVVEKNAKAQLRAAYRFLGV